MPSVVCRGPECKLCNYICSWIC